MLIGVWIGNVEKVKGQAWANGTTLDWVHDLCGWIGSKSLSMCCMILQFYDFTDTTSVPYQNDLYSCISLHSKYH